MAIRSHRRPVVSGAEELLGASGEALADIEATGPVRVHGEVWSARSDRPLRRGQRVRVTGRQGLVLRVSAEQAEDDPS
jgi:membrane-bound serine protease (ClpP class)